MRTIARCGVILIAIACLAAPLSAQVAVGVMQFGGDKGEGAMLQKRLCELLPKSGGIAVIADSQLKEVMRIHETAQSLGSDIHDVTKIKVAEYLVTGEVESGRASVKVVEVNSASEVFARTMDLAGDREYACRRLAREIQDAIILHGASKRREVPGQAKPYMALIQSFVESLGPDDKSSFNYIAFYSAGSYRRPVAGDARMEEKAKIFLSVLRPNLLRSGISFAGMEAASPWMYITVIADKLGKKTKHRFGIIELEGGALAIGIYELLQR